MNVLIPSGVMPVANGGSQYYYYKPLSVADVSTFGSVNSYNGLLIGSVGAAGDYLDKVTAIVTNTNSRVMLQDISAVSYTASGTGTAFTNTTTVNFGVSAAQTSTQLALMVGQYFICTATVGTTVLVARKILGAVNGPGTTPNFNVTLTIEALSVNGVSATTISTTASQSFIAPLIELVPVSTTNGTYTFPLQMKSKYMGWRLFHDSGVSVIATGKFS